MFQVARHLLYGSHAAPMSHWVQQKAAATKKAVVEPPIKKPTLKPDVDPPDEAAPKPAKPVPKPEAKQAPNHQHKAAREVVPMEVDTTVQPPSQPPTPPPTKTHAPAPDGGETRAQAPLWEDATCPNPEVLGSKDKQEQAWVTDKKKQ